MKAPHPPQSPSAPAAGQPMAASAGGPASASAKGRTLASERLEVDRKVFVVDLHEGAEGRFLRIGEDAGGRLSTLRVPMADAAAFSAALRRVMQKK